MINLNIYDRKQPAIIKSLVIILIVALLISTGCVSNRPMLLQQNEVDPTDDIFVLHLKDSSVVEFPGKSGRFDKTKQRYYSTTADSLFIPAQSVRLASIVRHEITVGGVLLALGIVGGVIIVIGLANMDFKMKWEGDNGSR